MRGADRDNAGNLSDGGDMVAGVIWLNAFERYMERYGRVYDPVANAKAEAERAEVNARRNAKKAKKQ